LELDFEESQSVSLETEEKLAHYLGTKSKFLENASNVYVIFSENVTDVSITS